MIRFLHPSDLTRPSPWETCTSYSCQLLRRPWHFAQGRNICEAHCTSEQHAAANRYIMLDFVEPIAGVDDATFEAALSKRVTEVLALPAGWRRSRHGHRRHHRRSSVASIWSPDHRRVIDGTASEPPMQPLQPSVQPGRSFVDDGRLSAALPQQDQDRADMLRVSRHHRARDRRWHHHLLALLWLRQADGAAGRAVPAPDVRPGMSGAGRAAPQAPKATAAR
jgi:hypothetical protein